MSSVLPTSLFIGSMSASDYASAGMALAKAGKLERSLVSLDKAVGSGNLSQASDIFKGIIKDNPQYTIAAGSTIKPSTINVAFQSLATAIDSGKAKAATDAWTKVKSTLASSGLTSFHTVEKAASQMLSSTKSSSAKVILSSLANPANASSSLMESLIGGNTHSNDLMLTQAVSNWMTYDSGGSASSLIGNSKNASGTKLNQTA